MGNTKLRILSEEEVQDLLVQIREGSEEAKETLVKHRMGLVTSVINNRFRYTEHPMEDLISAGVEGLLIAINRYDASKGVNFFTYATPMVKGYTRTFALENGATRVPRKTRALAFKIRSRGLLDAPEEKVVEEFNIAEEDRYRVRVAQGYLRNGHNLLSTNVTVNHGESSSDDTDLSDLADYRNNDLNGDHWFDMVAIKVEASKLPELQQRILELSFNKEMSHPEIGKLLGMPPHQVGIQKRAAIDALRLAFLGEEKVAELKLKEKRKPFKRITPEQKEQIIKLLRETTLTYGEIGELVGVTHSPVSKLAKEHRSPEVIQANRKRVHRNLAQYQKDKKKKGETQNA